MTTENMEHVDNDTPDTEVVQDGVDSLLDGLVDNMVGEEPEVQDEPQEDEPQEDKQEQTAPAPRRVKIDDETEVDEQELIKGYLRQSDYTRKTQEIAEARKTVEPWKALIENIQSDPGLVEHIRGYKQQSQHQVAQDTPPDDPVEAIKWEAARAAEERVLQRLAPHLKTLQGNSVEAKRAHVMARLASDPMANDVRKSMADSLKIAVDAGAMSEQEAEARFNAWNNDPDVFASAYMVHRERVAKARGDVPAIQPTATAGKVKTEVRERAPVLESAAANVPTGDAQTNKQKVRELKKRASNGDKDAVLDWLEASGALGKILK